MPTAIFTHLAAITPESIAAGVARVSRAADKARAELDRMCSSAAAGGMTLDAIAAYRDGTCTCTAAYGCGRGEFDARGILRARADDRSAALQLRDAKTRASRMRPSPAAVRIAVVDSYEIKDSLRTAGYRFDRDGYWCDPVGAHTKAAWYKEISPDLADTEIARLESIGCAIELDSEINALVVGIRRAV
jgi:hypothetical protein